MCCRRILIQNVFSAGLASFFQTSHNLKVIGLISNRVFYKGSKFTFWGKELSTWLHRVRAISLCYVLKQKKKWDNKDTTTTPPRTFTRTDLNHRTNFSLPLVETELYSSVHNQAALKSFILINWQVFMKYRARFQIPELFNLKNSLIINTEIAPLTSIILHSPVHDLITKPDKMTVINRKKR